VGLDWLCGAGSRRWSARLGEALKTAVTEGCDGQSAPTVGEGEIGAGVCVQRNAVPFSRARKGRGGGSGLGERDGGGGSEARRSLGRAAAVQDAGARDGEREGESGQWAEGRQPLERGGPSAVCWLRVLCLGPEAANARKREELPEELPEEQPEEQPG